MGFSLRTRRSAITFDLGGAGIRACQFQRRAAHLRLCDALCLDRDAAVEVPTPPAEGDAPAEPAFSIDPAQLRRLTGQGGFVGREVALVLSPPEVRFFPLNLPDSALQQPRERLHQALRWEVARESRERADELEVRHWVLPRGQGLPANVMAVALSTVQAAAWAGAFEPHGLALRRIDVSPCALVRIARLAWTPGPHDLWGVLDLGARHSTLTLVVGEIPAYIRSFPLAAGEWTARIAAAFEVSEAVAEQLKREHGVAAPAAGVAPAAAGRTPLHGANLGGAVASVLRGPVRALAHEIGRCFSYLLQGFPSHVAQRLYLAGGGADLKGLAALLSAELELPVHRLSSRADESAPAWERPLPHVECRPLSAAALGAALLDLESA